jgi:phosphate acetyltransferase
MKFIESVFQKLKRHPKRIVFPEGIVPRVLRAACKYAKLRLGAPIMLGKRTEVERVAAEEKLDLENVGIIDPETSSDLQVFCERLEKLRHYRDLGEANAKEIVMRPNYFAAMMVQYGQVDGVVTGTSAAAGRSLRPLIQVVKPLPGVETISSCMILELSNKNFGEKGVLFFADCAVIPEPTVDQLAMIAVETGKLFAQLTGIRPRVAMLSFSTKGSTRLPQTEKIAAATALARQKVELEDVQIEVDGELQADSALLPNLAERKDAASTVAGRANVLIFPDLNSGNIAVKLVHHLAGAEAYGQVLLGLSKPCIDVSRSATDEDILGAAAIAGLQAIEYRKLYPTEKV